MVNEREKIGSLLIRYGFITEDDLTEGLKLQKLMGLKLGETLVKAGKIDEANVQWILSKQFDVPFVIVDQVHLDIDLIHKFPKNFLLENRIIPLLETHDEICIVTDDIFNYEAFAFIEKIFNKKVNISIGEAKRIENTLINFYKEDASPTVTILLQKTIEMIKETGFYRIDIHIQQHKCELNVYGNGVIRKVAEVNITLKKEDVFRALNMLETHYIYEMYDNYRTALFSVYPLFNTFKDIKYPAILGISGLILPNWTTFIDMKSSECEHLIHSDHPLYGYPYFAFKDSAIKYDRVIFIPDSAPKDFTNYYIFIYAPQRCNFCDTAGCEKCKQLGYIFKKIEGIYSSNELRGLFS
ncbi:MAG: hypothetical protein N2511_02660 [Thermodesulfovibrionales bacterium]|nr:hypothetical protein [Thermodesulfovibrionales bacterium]